METLRIGKRGTIVIPASLRAHLSLKEGDIVITELHEDGLFLKPTVTLPVETYSRERQAEFLLSNAISKKDYQIAKKAVEKMGLKPETIQHYSPYDEKS